MQEKSTILNLQNEFASIFLSFKLAIQPTKLVIGLLAVSAICIVGWLMDLKPTVTVLKNTAGRTLATELDIYLQNPELVREFISKKADKSEQLPKINLRTRRRQPVSKDAQSSIAGKNRQGLFSTLWHFNSNRFHVALVAISEFDIVAFKKAVNELLVAAKWALKFHFMYSAVFLLISLALTAVAGGAICRITALQFALNEKPGITQALKFSIGKFKSFFLAPILPLFFVAIAAVVMMIVGLIANLPWLGELFLALMMPAVLIAGTFATLFIVGGILGAILLYPAIAYEASDCFDALSRAYHYTCKKPWRTIFHTVTAGLYGALCYIFVRFFIFLLLFTSRFLLDAFIWVNNKSGTEKIDALWPKPTFFTLITDNLANPENLFQDISAFIIRIVLLLVVGLLVAFIVSFFFSASTVIYALIRQNVDGTATATIKNGFGNNDIKSHNNSGYCKQMPKSTPDAQTD
jgi:hypothetical protein